MNRSCWRAPLPAVLLLWISHSLAGSLQVTPVRLRLASEQSATALTLRNPGDAPLYARVRAFSWEQVDGDDRLTAQQDLVPSPPVAVIAPGQEQLVRLVRINHAPTEQEQSFRLIIDEVAADAVQTPRDALEIRVQYSLPVFVDGSTYATAPRLRWSLARRDGTWYLNTVNEGRLHAQLSAVQMEEPTGKRYAISEGLLGYALAGRTHTWPLPSGFVPPAAGRMLLHLLVNGQPSDAEVRATDVVPVAASRNSEN